MKVSDNIYDKPELLLTKESGFVPELIIDKPWGWERLLALTEDYAMKILHVNAGEKLSFQYHERKRESLYCVSGEGLAFIGPDEDNLERLVLEKNKLLHIEPGTRHTFQAITELELIETSTPEIDDVVRLEDKYGRA